MKLKIEDGKVALDDKGLPIYIHDDGSEVGFDAPAAALKIKELNSESAERRVKNKELTDTLKAFEGIEDPAAALKALETVSNIDAKKLVDAGEMETLKRQLGETLEAEKASLVKTFETERSSLQEQLVAKDQKIYDLMVSSQFAKSPFFTGENPQTILPPDVASEYFGKYFKVEGEGTDIKVIGYLNGEQIPSREKFGEPAGFEEALGVIIDKYEFKDRIMRSGHDGTGAGSGNTGSRSDGTTIKAGDSDAFDENLEGIALGKVKVEQ